MTEKAWQTALGSYAHEKCYVVGILLDSVTWFILAKENIYKLSDFKKIRYFEKTYKGHLNGKCA